MSDCYGKTGEEMEISREAIEQIITQILTEKIGTSGCPKNDVHRQEIAGVIKMEVPKIHVTETDRLDTGTGMTGYTHMICLPCQRVRGLDAESWKWRRPHLTGLWTMMRLIMS